jgi:hypothetical protein
VGLIWPTDRRSPGQVATEPTEMLPMRQLQPFPLTLSDEFHQIFKTQNGQPTFKVNEGKVWHKELVPVRA